MLTNHLVTVDGEQARCTAHFQATHIADHDLGENSYTLGGRYEFGLRRGGERWLIESVVMTPLWSTGNQAVLSAARADAQADAEADAQADAQADRDQPAQS